MGHPLTDALHTLPGPFLLGGQRAAPNSLQSPEGTSAPHLQPHPAELPIGQAGSQFHQPRTANHPARYLTGTAPRAPSLTSAGRGGDR